MGPRTLARATSLGFALFVLLGLMAQGCVRSRATAAPEPRERAVAEPTDRTFFEDDPLLYLGGTKCAAVPVPLLRARRARPLDVPRDFGVQEP